MTGRSWVAPPVAERARAALGVLLNAVTFLVEDMSRSEFVKPPSAAWPPMGVLSMKGPRNG